MALRYSVIRDAQASDQTPNTNPVRFVTVARDLSKAQARKLADSLHTAEIPHYITKQ